MNTPYLVNTAWAIVEQLVKDWQETPNLFFTEHDVQAELYSRLKNTLLNLGEFYVQDRPSESIIEKKCKFMWPRVNCEPSVIYDKEGTKIKPDIIMWDDLDSSRYPDIDERYSGINNEKDNWPILWACEIKFDCKYSNEKAELSEIRECFRKKDADNFNKDIEKMKTLLSYGDKNKPFYGAQYAAVLNIVKAISQGDGFLWDDEFKEGKGRLWMLHAYLPE